MEMSSRLRRKLWIVNAAMLGAYVVLFVILYVQQNDINIVFGSETAIDVSILVPLIAAIIVYFLSRRQSEIERKQSEEDKKDKASKSLYSELESIYKAISGSKVCAIDGDVTYTNKHLNHDIYDSLLKTGYIFYIENDKQQTVQDIIETAKMHNQYLERADHLLAESYAKNKLEQKIQDAIFSYQKGMQECETILSKEIADILNQRH